MLTLFLRKLQSISQINELVAKTCDTSFLYWHRQLVPVYFDYLFESKVEAYRLNVSIKRCTILQWCKYPHGLSTAGFTRGDQNKFVVLVSGFLFSKYLTWLSFLAHCTWKTYECVKKLQFYPFYLLCTGMIANLKVLAYPAVAGLWCQSNFGALPL